MCRNVSTSVAPHVKLRFVAEQRALGNTGTVLAFAFHHMRRLTIKIHIDATGQLVEVPGACSFTSIHCKLPGRGKAANGPTFTAHYLGGCVVQILLVFLGNQRFIIKNSLFTRIRKHTAAD
jgi:hypothetical protein